MNRVAPLLAWFLAMAPPATAGLTIDDFETGGFSHTTSTVSVLDTLTVPTNGHAIHSPRTLIVTPLGGTVTATLSPGSEPDDKVYVTIEGDGVFGATWDWGYPADLTQNGAQDRIEILLTEVVAGGSVRLLIDDDDPQFGGQIEIRTVTAPGIVSIPFSEFTLADPTRATKISISCWGEGNSGTFALAHARIARSNSIIPTYVPEWVDMEWPPFPGPPVEFSQLDVTGLSQYRARIRLEDWYPPDPVIHAQWEEIPFFDGEIGHMDFLYEGASEFTTMVQFSFQFLQDSEYYPTIPNNPGVATDDLGFALTFPVVMDDQNGGVLSNSLTQIRFDAGAAQPLRFSNVVVDLQQSRGSPTVEMVVTFDLETTGEIDQLNPLMEMTWTADLAEGAVSTGVEVVGAQASDPLELVAWPSVTRAGTEFRLSRPLATASAVEIFDVTGRLVQSLPLTVGARAVAWDGRTSEGALTAAGVYFARTTRVPSAPARLVRIR